MEAGVRIELTNPPLLISSLPDNHHKVFVNPTRDESQLNFYDHSCKLFFPRRSFVWKRFLSRIKIESETMKILCSSLLIISSFIAAQAQQQPDYQRLKAEAEKFYAEASYA